MSETITGIKEVIHKMLTETMQDWDRMSDLSWDKIPSDLHDTVKDHLGDYRSAWADGDRAKMTTDPMDLTDGESILGFLSPEGIFYENPSYHGHQETCERLAKALGLSYAAFMDPQYLLVDRLGWVKFAAYRFKANKKLYGILWEKSPTGAQSRFLMGLIKACRHHNYEINEDLELAIIQNKEEHC